jgi:hypothetical protein
MSKDESKEQLSKTGGPLDRFEAGGDRGPMEDRNEYERRLSSLSPERKELAQESARLGDLCQYFSQQKMDIPPEVMDRIGRLHTVAIVERVRSLKDINRALMEYLNDVDHRPRIRQ